MDPKKGRKVKVGVIDGGVFYKRVTRKKHYLNIANGYAIQEDVFMNDEPMKIVDAFSKHGVQKINIFEEDTGETLVIGMLDFLMYSRPWTHGHGRQLVISEKFFKKEKEKEKVQ
jgi:hypothetical protein